MLKTLKKAVESMMVADDELRNLLDILIVNDGSKDGTLQLATKLQNEYPGIVRVWDKENGGHGSTINIGIEHSYGKYLKVVDGDDWLDTVAFEKFLKILCMTEADMIATDYYYFYEKDARTEIANTSLLPYDVTIRIENIKNDFTFKMPSYAIKTSLLRDQPYRLDEQCYYVDTELDALVLLSVQTILYVDIKLYVYRRQQETQSVSIQGWMNHYADHTRVGKTLVKWYQLVSNNHNFSNTRITFLGKNVIEFIKFHYRCGFGFCAKEQKMFVKNLKAFDSWLKSCGYDIYLLTNKDPVIHCCRIFNFSTIMYAVIAIIIKLKRKIHL